MVGKSSFSMYVSFPKEREKKIYMEVPAGKNRCVKNQVIKLHHIKDQSSRILLAPKLAESFLMRQTPKVPVVGEMRAQSSAALATMGSKSTPGF